tara:strand:- start:5060 stop:5230 length:171 start_codon:yes stop_codon:yes gene_type:complete
MVNKNFTEFFGKIPIQKVPEEFENEFEILQKLGVGCRELEYLVFLRIKKEITICLD